MKIAFVICGLLLVQPVWGIESIPVCTEPGEQCSPDVSGTTVVWRDGRTSGPDGFNIYMWDTIHGEQVVCTDPGDRIAPAISNSTIVWQECRNATSQDYDIYMGTPSTGRSRSARSPDGRPSPRSQGT